MSSRPLQCLGYLVATAVGISIGGFLRSDSLCWRKPSSVEYVTGRSFSNNNNSKNATSVAFLESNGVLDGISDSAWERMREHARTFDQYLPERMGGPAKWFRNPRYWHVSNLEPILPCLYSRRVGGHGDGPKWICNPSALKAKKDCLIYSFGSAGKYEFEDAMVDILPELNCEIHVFDPNPRFDRRGQNAAKNIHFHAWGFKSSYIVNKSSFELKNPSLEFKSFPEIIQALGHEKRRIDILKMDCEECEWGTLRDWISADIMQISIEVHGVGPADPSEFFDAFPSHGFAMFSKEINGLSPTCVEFSFLKMRPQFWENATIFKHKHYGNRIFGPHPELKKVQ